jgi:hypothetical protein
MSRIRSRHSDDGKDEDSSIALTLDDFLPFFGSVSLLPIVINASVKIKLSEAGPGQTVAIAAATLASVLLLLIAVSSVRTKEIGRYVSLLALIPVLLMALFGLEIRIFQIVGIAFVVLTALVVDLAGE